MPDGIDVAISVLGLLVLLVAGLWAAWERYDEQRRIERQHARDAWYEDLEWDRVHWWLDRSSS